MSTIIGNVEDIGAAIAQQPVRAHAILSPVWVDGSIIYTGKDVSTRSDHNGDFTLNLVAGRYKLIIGDTDIIEFPVPDDPSGTYDIITLLDPDFVFSPPVPVPGGAVIKTTDFTITAPDSVNYRAIAVNAAAAPVTLTLPPMALVPGYNLAVAKIDASANLVKIKGNNADLITGVNQVQIDNQWGSYILQNINGAFWIIA